MIYYSKQEDTCFGCMIQPSPGFTFIVMKCINTVGMTHSKFVYPTEGHVKIHKCGRFRSEE